MACDMFGFQLHNIPIDIRVLFQLTMTFSISFIKLFQVVRINKINNMHLKGPLLIGEEELLDGKSDNISNVNA
jgi:hypothetical protein